MRTIKSSFSMLALILTLFGAFSCANSEKEIPAPKIYLNIADFGIEMEMNDTVKIEPKITYDYNSEYQWIENGVVVSTQKNLILTANSYGSRRLTFKVSTPSGRDEVDVPVDVIVLSDLERFDIKDNSVIYDASPETRFIDRIIIYPNQGDKLLKTWNGFAVSNRFMTSTADSSAAFNVNAQPGTSKAKKFGVFHYNSSVENRILFSDKKTHDLKSIDICNNLFTAQTAKYGFEKAQIPKFEKGDYLSVVVTAYSGSGVALSSAEMVLVDYRFDNPGKYFILSSWKTLSLGELKEAFSVGISFKTTRPDIPHYVCIDNLKLKN